MTVRGTASERITRARSRLLLDQPWFGSLSLRLSIQESPELTKTMSTDGSRLVFNAGWVADRTDAELMALVAHEVLHCALLHPYRVGGRDLKLWNLACDFAINPMLTRQGFRLPDGMANDPQYDGLSADTIYARLHRDQQQPPADAPGGAPDQPDFTPAPTPNQQDNAAQQQPGPEQPPSEPRMTASDWQIAAEQATAVARKAGKMDGGVDRSVRDARRPAADWRTVTSRFVERTMPSDYSWSSPNRHYIAAGLYLPGVVRERIQRLPVAIDTSASIDQELLDLFGGQLTAILHEVRPDILEVVYCDSKVQAVERFTPDDPAVELHPKGGGGTRFQPVFDHLREDPPPGLIYFTDLEGPAPTEPDYPVLWVTTEAATRTAPFGETVVLSPWQS